MRHASTISRFAVLVAILVGCATAPTTFAGERIVAIGDIHGNYDGFVSILQRAGLVDDDVHWIGGDTTFVQTGDIFDRGLEVFEVLGLLKRLEKEAAAAGGEVIVLLGNHEGMNLVGFFRDVRVFHEPSPRGWIVIFEVEESPVVRQISISGNESVESDKIRDILTLTTGSTLDYPLLFENRERIGALYRAQGYYLAEVDYEIESLSEHSVSIHFMVNEHKKLKLRKIVFQDNEHFSDRELT